MKLNKSIVATLLCTVALMGCKSTPVEETILVPTPPMGWNSLTAMELICMKMQQ